MKFAMVVLSLAALGSKSEVSFPGNNHDYMEGESRYIWIPDGDGVPHLADLQQPKTPLSRADVIEGPSNEYWLFSRSNPTSPQFIVHGNENTLRSSNYVGRKPLAVIVHGWYSNGNSSMNPLITSAFLAVQDCNVIVVDWRKFANDFYWTSAKAVPSVGEYLGKFLIWLFATGGGNWNKLHLVGFSLGAHVVGNAGRTVGGRSKRVTGLDPAGPLWYNNPDAINNQSGRYVEIIHTDGGILGLFDPLGHADFYPNGGRNPQPGCILTTCSHSRAPQLFAASVKFNNMVGRRCKSLWEAKHKLCSGISNKMGNGDLRKHGSGTYGLVTGSVWPFVINV